MRPAAGTVLGGRYRLVSPIAVGGMGEVWVGNDGVLARDVAVKVLREELAGDAGSLARFRAEARNSARLSHPNIAQLFDYGEQDGSAYLVMELVPGGPLSEVLDREHRLEPARLVPILAQTARALDAAHRSGVVHRDVKPGNILLEGTGPTTRVKITDFGISISTSQLAMTATGMVMGTAQYLSPEQAIGRPATPLSDIYSLGIVAYEALAGHRPFTGPTAVDIAMAQVSAPVPPLPPVVDRPLGALVGRMLAKRPEDRPPTAAALADALDQILGRTPPRGTPLGTAPAAGGAPSGGTAAPPAPAGSGPPSGGTAALPAPAGSGAPAGPRPPSFPPSAPRTRPRPGGTRRSPERPSRGGHPAEGRLQHDHDGRAVAGPSERAARVHRLEILLVLLVLIAAAVVLAGGVGAPQALEARSRPTLVEHRADPSPVTASPGAALGDGMIDQRPARTHPTTARDL